jgi:hypothetical protein
MKKSFCLLITLSLVLLSGCGLFTAKKQTYAVNSMLIAVNLHDFQTYFNKVVLDLGKAQQREKPPFSDSEWVLVTNFCGTINFIIAQERTIMQLQLKSIDDEQLKGIITLAQKGYSDSYTIIESHWNSFSQEEQAELLLLHNTAKELNNSIEKLYNDVSKNTIDTNQVLNVIMNVLTVSVKILTVVAA